MKVDEYINSRVKKKGEHTKQLLTDNGKVRHTLATYADIALLGEVRLGNNAYAAYSAPLLKGCGMTEEHMVKADKIAFLSPGVLPLEDIVMALWHYQATYSASSSVPDVLLNVRTELNSIEENIPEYMEEETIGNQMNLAESMTKTLEHLLHLFALTGFDPAAELAKRLQVLKEDV